MIKTIMITVDTGDKTGDKIKSSVVFSKIEEVLWQRLLDMGGVELRAAYIDGHRQGEVDIFGIKVEMKSS